MDDYSTPQAVHVAQQQLARFDAELADLKANRARYAAHPASDKKYRELLTSAQALQNRIMTGLNVANVARSDELRDDLDGLGFWPIIARIGLPALKWGAIGTAVIGAGKWVSDKLALDALTDRIAQGIEQVTGDDSVEGGAKLRNTLTAGGGLILIGLAAWLFFSRSE